MGHWSVVFVKIKKDSFIRIFDNTGYIVNKTTFSDRITDESGAIFLSTLSRDAKAIDEIAGDIIRSFIDADLAEIKQDCIDFFGELERDGFIVSGETLSELEKKDSEFLDNSFFDILKNKSLSLSQTEIDTKTYLDNYFQNSPRLMSLHIELTTRCNEQCIHCYLPHKARTKDIEASFFYSVLEQCHRMGVLDITLSGGEPLLHPNFCDFLQKAKEHDFSIAVSSNLTMLNENILLKMKDVSLSSVHVSLYSMKAEIHDSITQLSGSFEKTKCGILKLIENNIPVQINCPVMKQNKNCYKDVLRWGHENKCRVLTDFIMMAKYDHTTDNILNRLSPEETEEVMLNIINNDVVYQQKFIDTNFENKYASNKDISNDIVCGVCKTSLCMAVNGNMYPCPGWQDYVCGNVKESTLKNIWRNSAQIKYLQSLRRKDFPKCLKCEDREFCALCIARNANEDSKGNIFKINNHVCKVAAINRKIAIEWRTKHLQKFDYKNT